MAEPGQMVTLDAVAAQAGVSRDTVSRVLNGRTKEIWPSMVQRAERIRRIAVEMGYRPHAAALAGLGVPTDLSVLSFADQPRRPFGRPETTVVVPAAKVGQMAVEMVLAKLANLDEPASPVMVEESLKAGLTTGPPKPECVQGRNG